MSDKPQTGDAVDWYASPTSSRIHDEQHQWQPETPMYFAVSTTKLAVLSLATMGLYPTYWFFKNFQLQAERAGSGRYLGPAVRAAFSGFLAYGLFTDIRRQAELTGSGDLRAGWLALAWLVLPSCGYLPQPYTVIAFFGFLPLLLVQRTVSEINAKLTPNASRNERFGRWQTLGCGIGLIFLVLGIAVTFVPELAVAGVEGLD